ncbi:phytoene desaturase family protein [Nocardia sp. NPDC048505]|uniref:phytoene desaturase family protein n=1 Tax=unclassified Nocardia TaxID=2637762 RepID=UPI0033FFAD92
MRTTTGRTDHVVVVGAGLAGLSAALHLAGRGRSVTVVERESTPGGRMGRLDIDGYRIDTGPTVLTMPDLLDEAFAAVGERTADRLELLPVAPAYQARFADGRTLEVHSDADEMTRRVGDFAGAAQAEGYRRLRAWLTDLYAAENEQFIGANFDSPFSLLTPALARLIALGGFRAWDRKVAQFITDPDLRRVFTFQSLYAGVAPQHARAAYAVIAYMDTMAGVYFPRGGMRAVPDAMAAAAESAGVRFRYGAAVSELVNSGGRVHAVRTEQGEEIACDAVVLTTELRRSQELLGRRSRRPVPVRPAPSAVILHLSCERGSELPHHSLLFGAAWQTVFREIIDRGQVMSDPSLLLTRPTAADPTLAPPGRDLLYLLAPAPNLARGDIDWDAQGPAYAAQILDTARRRLGPDALRGAELLRLVTPADWARQGMLAGSPFALAHTFVQTGPFRPNNLVRGVGNAVLAGGSTIPGVGIPPVLISGRLAADRITGPRRVAPAATERQVR